LARKTRARARPSAKRKATRGGAPSPRWDAGALQTSYANACALHSTREAVEAFFGIDRRLTHRIVIAPTMAKRLARLLSRVVRDYEREFGELATPPAG